MDDYYIKKEELVAGIAYAVDARNFSVAIWTGEEFAGLRHKLGSDFIDYEHHWDDGVLYGTVKPREELM